LTVETGSIGFCRGRRPAFQTPEQTPDGPRPAQGPLPWNLPRRPAAWAMRGPATALGGHTAGQLRRITADVISTG